MCIYSQATKGTDYMARYIEYIKTLGYAETTIDDLTYYVKDEVKIRIGESNENADFSTYIYFGKVEQ